MLKKFFNKLLVRKQKSISMNKHKPLALQTVYRQKDQPFIAKERELLCGIEQSSLIEKRHHLLKNDDYYHGTQIEVCSLNKNTTLIGLTKHTHTILSAIFLYPEPTRFSKKWNALRQQAAKLNTGIAIFSTTQDIDCLKVTQDAEETSVIYLVDHRAIQRTKWLLHPPSGKALTKNSVSRLAQRNL